MYSKVNDDKLIEAMEELKKEHPEKVIRAWMIRAKVLEKHNEDLNESTIRGRFVMMGRPLCNQAVAGSSTVQVEREVTTQQQAPPEPEEHSWNINPHLRMFIPETKEFENYVERPIDKALAVCYDKGKNPIAQGKQGTGKTYAHKYYAFKKQLPFFLFSCYEDMKLNKLFGDKTIKNGTVEFQESIFVKACQCPSVILFDEINAVNVKKTFDWHALLQNKELYVKDRGIVYRLHKECRMGFAQNPKSSKYIGGNIMPANLLGRMVFLSFPEFTKAELEEAVKKKYTSLKKADMDNYILYYMKLNDVIERAKLPIDISIRQLFNTIDLRLAGLDLKNALNIGIVNLLDSVSQPQAKDSLLKIASMIWKEIMVKEETK